MQDPRTIQGDVRQYDQLVRAIRQAGLLRDRSQIQASVHALAHEVLQAARNVPSVRRAAFYIQTAVLLACARIGDPSAIAHLKQVAPHLDPHLKHAVRMCSW
ncbi:MAG: hypothetical protein C4336_09055, partial [Armatimonadota bacterium]